MSFRETRRRFLRTAAASAAALSWPRRGPLRAAGSQPAWTDLPRLEGTLVRGDALRREMATDRGGHVEHVPAAVLQPRSARDVSEIVRFAQRHRLKVAVRGRGHSQYGQTLAGDGIVIDSRTLAAVAPGPGRTVEAQAGASWEDVLRVTLARGLTPPALGDTPQLSVGGILSSGGVGNTSHRHGAVVDNVEELDVVTGTGERLTCSRRRNADLFDLALAGMGQCALIVGARLRLVEAPPWVVRRDLDYDELPPFLSDLSRLAAQGRAEHLGAYVLAGEDGRGWRFRINVGRFCAAPGQADFGEVESGLRYLRRGEPAAAPFADYLRREAARNAAVEAARRATPSRGFFITMFLPASAAEGFLAGMLAHPPETAGTNRFSLYVLPTHRFTRPMFVLPQDDLVLNFWLLRWVPRADERGCAETAATLRGLVEKMRRVSGKIFPPYAPFYTVDDWKDHYGEGRWARLRAGKETYDPGGVLTPGMADP